MNSSMTWSSRVRRTTGSCCEQIRARSAPMVALSSGLDGSTRRIGPGSNARSDPTKMMRASTTLTEIDTTIPFWIVKRGRARPLTESTARRIQFHSVTKTSRIQPRADEIKFFMVPGSHIFYLKSTCKKLFCIFCKK